MQTDATRARLLIKRTASTPEAVPHLTPFSSSDVDDRDDPVVAINDDDLIADDEVHVPAPLGVDSDERRGNRHHMHVKWHVGANADGEVDVIDPRYIAAGQHRLPNLRALLRGQADAATRLALLRLTLLRLSLLRSLAWLSLTWLSLPGLTGLTPLRRLTGLALLTLLALLTRGLLGLLLPLATLLGLTLLALLRSGFSLTLRRLTRGLPLLPALRLTLLTAILLRPLLMLTLGSLSCVLSFLAALRLALLLFLRGLLGLALLRRRLGLLALRGAAALFSSTLHSLS